MPPEMVAHTAKPRRMSPAVAVSRGPRRKAAHIGGSTARMASGAAPGIPIVEGLKAINPNAPAATKIAVDSRSGTRSNDGVSATHKTRTGVIMSTAAKSPSHHGNHIRANFSQLTCSMPPEAPRPVSTIEPTVAVMLVAKIAINTNLAIPVGTAKALLPPDHQLSRKPPTSASTAFAAAVTAVA